MIRKINGKSTSNSIGHLVTDEGNFTSKENIANVLADTFANKSSSRKLLIHVSKISSREREIKIKL